MQRAAAAWRRGDALRLDQRPRGPVRCNRVGMSMRDLPRVGLSAEDQCGPQSAYDGAVAAGNAAFMPLQLQHVAEVGSGDLEISSKVLDTSR